MQNSTVNSFPWVNPANFTSNTSNSSTTKSQWQEYQNLAADFLLKKNQNIYPSTISQLAAHSNYLEKMSNLASASNDMQSNQLTNQSQLPDLNDLNGLNEKCPHNENRNKYSCEICIQQYSLNLNSKNNTSNSGHLAMLSNSSLQNTNSLSSSKQNGQQMDGLNHQSSSTINHNGTTFTSASTSGRKCLNKGSFLCVICNKSFTQKGNLKTHQLIHSGQKPFTCQVCGKSFTQKGNVDTHMKIHTGEKKIKKVKQGNSNNNNKEKFYVKTDHKNQMQQKHKSSDLNSSTNLINSNQSLNINQNQSVMDRLLPMQLNNGHSPINFSNSTASSTSNWSNLTNNLANNLINNSSNNKSNRNSTNSSSANFQSNNYADNFANIAGYNSFAQQQMNLLLNQNGKHSNSSPTIQNTLMQQQLDLGQINNNYNGFL